MSKVSIIVPVYNAETLIERCINSILNQTYTNIEIICVNDGSEDNSLDKLNTLCAKDKRVKVFSQENRGQAYARNFAITKATGEYLMFCDADDWYEPNMVDEMVKAISKPDVDIAICRINTVNQSGMSVQALKFNLGVHNISKKYLKRFNDALWNKIFKMSFIKKFNITFPENYDHEDVVFLYKYLGIAKKYNGIKLCLYNYVVGNSNSVMGKILTNNNVGHEFDFIYSYKDLFNFIEKYASKKYIDFIVRKFFICFNIFVNKITDKDEAFNILKDFVNNTNLFKNKKYYQVECVKTSQNYLQYQEKLEKAQITIGQKLFSVKNEANSYKVLRLLGLKLRFKKKT